MLAADDCSTAVIEAETSAALLVSFWAGLCDGVLSSLEAVVVVVIIVAGDPAHAVDCGRGMELVSMTSVVGMLAPRKLGRTSEGTMDRGRVAMLVVVLS